MATERASAASSTPTPMIDTARLAGGAGGAGGRRSASRPLATKPASGSAGTSHRSCSAAGISALEQIDVLQVDRLLVAVDRPDDRQAHRRPNRRYRPHEEHQELACHAQRLPPRPEREG